MTYREVTFIGVATVSPEMVPCTLLFDSLHQRALPFWLPDRASELLSENDPGMHERRPTDVAVLLDVLDKGGLQIEALRVDSFFEGIFHCSLVLRDAGTIDCKPSQLLLLAQNSDIPIEVHEQVLVDASVKVPPHELLEYFGIEPPEDEASEQTRSASGDKEADADFAKLMEQMGMKESEWFPDISDLGDDTNDTDVIFGENDDDGAK